MTQYYILNCKSEILVKSNAKTLMSAKREASKQKSFGGGTLEILDQDDNLLTESIFWNTLNHFGWYKWTK